MIQSVRLVLVLFPRENCLPVLVLLPQLTIHGLADLIYDRGVLLLGPSGVMQALSSNHGCLERNERGKAVSVILDCRLSRSPPPGTVARPDLLKVYLD